MGEIDTHHYGERSPNVELGRASRQCIFIPGMYATNSGMQAERGIGAALIGEYGEENVTVFNSVISKDKPDPERFAKIEKEIKMRVSEGPLDLVAHSLGAVELAHVLKSIRKDDPDFFDNKEVQDNLRIRLIGPAGFNKGLVSKAGYIRRVLRVNGSEGRGFQALSAFSPKNIEPSDLSRAHSKISNKDAGVPLDTSENDDNEDYLSDIDKAAVATYDAELLLAIEQGNFDLASQITRDRGKGLSDPLEKVFEGNTDTISANKGKDIYSGIGIRMVIKAIGKKPMKEFAHLSNQGVRVDFVVPEYDIAVPLTKLVKYFKMTNDRIEDHSVVVEASDHNGVGLTPKRYSKILKSGRNR